MLALCTRIAPPRTPLPEAAEALAAWGLELGAVALHRPPRRVEIPGLKRGKQRILAVFADAEMFGLGEPGDVGCSLLVVDGGEAGPDREASLEDLCRRLHALRSFRVALRTPAGPEEHPSPAEVSLVAEALPGIGYWHDAARGGDDYLHAAAPLLFGASFAAAGTADLKVLRDALPGGAPVVVDGAPGLEREVVVDAVMRARGIFCA
ncbi:MAG: hypothetical protein ACE10D_11630 [Planctomycetota bacterium]|nr:hypothetical protein [Planctomycetota bacterium]